jgi:MoxR-like ATPase
MTGAEQDLEAVSLSRVDATRKADTIIKNINQVIIGKSDVVTQAVAALIAEGHILLEDVPGVGKTVLAKALAASIAGKFKRVQFTADLLPSDITGVTIYRQNNGEFTFRPGPLFANVLLGDEINRATPRTQSSLLEAMEESQATVDGERYELENPFLVMATQNPIELEGTYPLPFAQMDRFMVRLRLGYLPVDGERQMLRARVHGSPLEQLAAVVDCDNLLAIQAAVRDISITDELVDYLIAIVRQTRDNEAIEYGASPRGSLDLMRYSQAMALIAGRDYVLPDDIKAAAVPVLAHRVIVRQGTRYGTLHVGELLEKLVESIDVPV